MTDLPELPDTRYRLVHASPEHLTDPYYLVKGNLLATPDLRFYEIGFSSGKARVIGRKSGTLPIKDALQLGTFDTIKEAWAAILLHNSPRT